MNKYKKDLEQKLGQQECPCCKSHEIDIDNWNMFEGKDDWFYYCKECDYVF